MAATKSQKAGKAKARARKAGQQMQRERQMAERDAARTLDKLRCPACNARLKGMLPEYEPEMICDYDGRTGEFDMRYIPIEFPCPNESCPIELMFNRDENGDLYVDTIFDLTQLDRYKEENRTMKFIEDGKLPIEQMPPRFRSEILLRINLGELNDEDLVSAFGEGADEFFRKIRRSSL